MRFILNELLLSAAPHLDVRKNHTVEWAVTVGRDVTVTGRRPDRPARVLCPVKLYVMALGVNVCCRTARREILVILLRVLPQGIEVATCLWQCAAGSALWLRHACLHLHITKGVNVHA